MSGQAHPSQECGRQEHARGVKKRPSLANTLFAVLFSLSFVVMCAATCAATAASYEVYEGKAEQELLAQASEYSQALSQQPTDEMTQELSEISFVDVRCTLIDADGAVLFDNYTDPAALDNHANREEVRQAKESGQVAVMRRSDTLGTDTLYAASLVSDGVVLRLAETRVSLASFLGSMALPLVASLVVIFVLSLLVARGLTKTITRPFRDIDMANPLENDAYEEIQPLLERVDLQRRELEGQNAELERAVFTRREFTSNVSHEMKSPLQVIGGYAELMESGMVDASDVPRFAGLIRQEAQSMRGLIDDVLTLSRLDERVDAPLLPVDLTAVARRVCARLAPAAEERAVEIQQRFDASLTVQGDESLAEQMIYNLVSNAIKYNKEGGIVRVTVTPQVAPSRSSQSTQVDAGAEAAASGEGEPVSSAAAPLRAYVAVDDEGPGIPPEMRDRVFERFFRLDSSRSRETGGTGLGLAIVKHAALSLGGTVHVEDSDLGGSRFVVEL